MNRWIVPILIFAFVGFILSIVGLVVVLTRSAQRQAGEMAVVAPEPAAMGLSVPEFSLIDHSARPQSEQLFEGRITILDFIFTNCPFACPIMSMSMSELADRLRNSRVQFVSISVDAERDTPERLREFAARYEADLSRWTFLTGDQETVERMVMDSLKFALATDESQQITLPEGGTMSNIVHPTKLILVGPDRKVLGFYDPNSSVDMQRLEARARAAARALPPP